MCSACILLHFQKKHQTSKVCSACVCLGLQHKAKFVFSGVLLSRIVLHCLCWRANPLLTCSVSATDDAAWQHVEKVCVSSRLPEERKCLSAQCIHMKPAELPEWTCHEGDVYVTLRWVHTQAVIRNRNADAQAP